jgi:hypothetical protein
MKSKHNTTKGTQPLFRVSKSNESTLVRSSIDRIYQLGLWCHAPRINGSDFEQCGAGCNVDRGIHGHDFRDLVGCFLVCLGSWFASAPSSAGVFFR